MPSRIGLFKLMEHIILEASELYGPLIIQKRYIFEVRAGPHVFGVAGNLDEAIELCFESFKEAFNVKVLR